MISHEEARARVHRGAAHLDQVRPVWWNEIDVGTLTIRDADDCVIGQLAHGNGWTSVSDQLTDCDVATAHGVYTNQHEDYPLLQDAWIEAIADRKLAAVPQPVAVLVTR